MPSEAQKRATINYSNTNREVKRHASMKSTSKSFINKYATPKELEELLDLVKGKLEDTKVSPDVDIIKKKDKRLSKDEIIKRVDEYVKENKMDISDKKERAEAVKNYGVKYNITQRLSQSHFKKYEDEKIK